MPHPLGFRISTLFAFPHPKKFHSSATSRFSVFNIFLPERQLANAILGIVACHQFGPYSSALVPCITASKMFFPMLAFLIVGSMLPTMAARIDMGTPQTSAAKLSPNAMLLLPTPAPVPAPTEPPKGRWGSLALFKRAGGPSTPNLCGWTHDTCKSSLHVLVMHLFYTNRDITAPLPMYCRDEDATCTNQGTYRACCKESQCTNDNPFFTTCYDATAHPCSGSVGKNTLCW